MTWKGGQQAVRNRMLQIFCCATESRQPCLVKELTRPLPKEEGEKKRNESRTRFKNGKILPGHIRCHIASFSVLRGTLALGDASAQYIHGQHSVPSTQYRVLRTSENLAGQDREYPYDKMHRSTTNKEVLF